MSFYNPYQQGPAVGQGMQDMISQIIQIMMMKKMAGDGKQRPQPQMPQPQPTTPLPQARGGAPSPGAQGNLPPGTMPDQYPPQMGAQQGGQSGISPELIRMIMMMFQNPGMPR